MRATSPPRAEGCGALLLACALGACGASASVQGGTSTPPPEAPPREAPRVDPAPTPDAPTSQGPALDARFYVGIANASTLASDVGPELLDSAHRRMRASIASLEGVALSPREEATADAIAIARRRSLVGLYVQCAVRRVDTGPQGTRAAVSMLITTLGSQDVLAALQGGAIVPGEGGAAAERSAVEGAVDSALRGLPTVLATLASR